MNERKGYGPFGFWGYDVPMTKLTQKQENFCAAYVETGNASEAYRRAYDASRMKPDSVSVNASKLMADARIALRLAELRQPVIEAAQITLASHLARLEELSIGAEKAGQYSAAIGAEISRGKACGLYTEKVESTVTSNTYTFEVRRAGTEPK